MPGCISLFNQLTEVVIDPRPVRSFTLRCYNRCVLIENGRNSTVEEVGLLLTIVKPVHIAILKLLREVEEVAGGGSFQASMVLKER